MILVPLFDLKFLRRTRDIRCRNFKSAALVPTPSLAGRVREAKPACGLSRAAWGASEKPRGRRGERSVKHVAGRNPPPPIGPREVNFSPYLSIQLPPFGDYFRGWGALAFVWLESAGVDAVVALGRAVRAPFQRDIFAQSDRQGGASLWRDSLSLWCDIRASLRWRGELPYGRRKRRADPRWRRRPARRSR